MKKMTKNKKGYYFSLDAFIALIVILAVVLVVKPSVNKTPPIVSAQDDLLSVLSSVKVGEVDNDYVKMLITNGQIKNLNQTVLEQIGEFYAESKPEANFMAQSILDELNPDNDIGLYFNGVLIASNNKTSLENARDIWTARQIISGIQAGESATGYSARAFLSSSNRVEYFYFGGYVGDGNITIEFEDNVVGAEVEAVFGGDFKLYINNQFVGTYYPTPDVPLKINLNSQLNKFVTGTNYIEFRSASTNPKNLYIAGGFVKINHDDSSALGSLTKKNFPGIKGLINFYDSFYVPGRLESMSAYLHYNSTTNIFLKIGNKTVYSGNSNGDDVSVTLNDAVLSSLLDYSEMNERTIPMRLGLVNASFVLNETNTADVISVTDLSGSMKDCSGNGSFFCCAAKPNQCRIFSECNSCGGIWNGKLTAAKQANRDFINIILGLQNNRVGLVGFRDKVTAADHHDLSFNNASLQSKVNSWQANGATCICCGINKAVTDLVFNSSSENFRSIVVMSDGEATNTCAQQGTGNPSQDAINAACQAYNNYGIVVHAIGFGSISDEVTMQAIAACGRGNYYYSNVGELSGIYTQIAEDIIEASYVEQTILTESFDTKLYSDSYISFNYNKTIPYGLVITAETPDFGNTISEGSFFMPNDTSAYEVRVVSYSGSRWTDKVYYYNNASSTWNNVFDLSSYNGNYVEVGDPFVVNVPSSYMTPGNNLIRVSSSLEPGNASVGSVYDKIIYTLVKDISSFSPIVSSAEGCNWIIEFEDRSNSTISVPSTYNGIKTCTYNSISFPAYNPNDAIDVATLNLLESLDLNKNGKVETKFSEQDLVLSTTQVKGIPFTWDTEVQARVWR